VRSDKSQSTFRWNTLPLPSWSNNKPSKKPAWSRQAASACYLPHSGVLLGLSSDRKLRKMLRKLLRNSENADGCQRDVKALRLSCWIRLQSSHWQLNCMNTFNVLIWVIFLLKAFLFQWFFQLIQGPGLLFSSVIIFHRRTPWTSDQPVARPLPKHRTTWTQNKSIYTPNIHALSEIRTHDPSARVCEDSSDCAATVTGSKSFI
jgi:hypothetical protein